MCKLMIVDFLLSEEFSSKDICVKVGIFVFGIELNRIIVVVYSHIFISTHTHIYIYTHMHAH